MFDHFSFHKKKGLIIFPGVPFIFKRKIRKQLNRANLDNSHLNLKIAGRCLREAWSWRRESSNIPAGGRSCVRETKGVCLLQVGNWDTDTYKRDTERPRGCAYFRSGHVTQTHKRDMHTTTIDIDIRHTGRLRSQGGCLLQVGAWKVHSKDWMWWKVSCS